jgi:hypothetical protein
LVRANYAKNVELPSGKSGFPLPLIIIQDAAFIHQLLLSLVEEEEEEVLGA